MKKIKKVMLSLVLSSLLIVCGCENNNGNSDNNSKVDPSGKAELQGVDTVNEGDTSSIENQLNVIINKMAENSASSFRYYTVSDLDNNGRLEILYVSSYGLVSLMEVTEDFCSLQDKGSLEMLINSEGEKTIKYYKDDQGYSYVGYDKYGNKLVYNEGNDSIFNYSVIYEKEFRDLFFYPDGDGNFLFPEDNDYEKYLTESKKIEDEYFEKADSVNCLCLKWNDALKGFDKDLLIETYQSNTRKEFSEMSELEYISAFTGYRFISPEKQGLSDEVLALFKASAVFFPESDFSNGDVLYSTDINNLNNFFYEMKCDGRELVHEYDSTKNITTTLYKMPYEEWNYMLKEVYNEQDTNRVSARLDTKFNGEMNAYYVASDNCIYLEHGPLGISFDYAKVKNVEKTQDGFKISYCIYSGFSEGTLIEVVDSYIVNDDNKFGYRLIKNESVY